MTIREFEISDELTKVFIDFGDGTHLKADLSKLLLASRDDADDISDEEYEYLLEICSFYRASFLSAYTKVLQIRKQLEVEFDHWKAERMETAEKDIKFERIQEKEKKERSTIGTISKDAILNRVISESYEEYKDYTLEISKLKAMEDKLRGIHDILGDRGYHLMAIIKRRTADRTRSEFEA